MLNIPLLVLSLVIITSYSALFHLLWGETLKELFVYWLAALIGFSGGQLLASVFAWSDVMIGELHLLVASAICWLFMAFAKQLHL